MNNNINLVIAGGFLAVMGYLAIRPSGPHGLLAGNPDFQKVKGYEKIKEAINRLKIDPHAKGNLMFRLNSVNILDKKDRMPFLNRLLTEIGTLSVS